MRVAQMLQVLQNFQMPGSPFVAGILIQILIACNGYTHIKLTRLINEILFIESWMKGTMKRGNKTLTVIINITMNLSKVWPT